MSLDPMNPQNISQMIQHNQMRLVQGGSLLDQPTFSEKLKAGLAKFGAVFGRIAGSIVKFFPVFGPPASAALYGLSDFAQYSYEKGVNKRLNTLARDEAMASLDPSQFVLPGLGMFSRPRGADMADGLGQDKLGVVLNREIAARQEIENFSG